MANSVTKAAGRTHHEALLTRASYTIVSQETIQDLLINIQRVCILNFLGDLEINI